MQKPYFVMFYNQFGTKLVPMLDKNDELIMFSTYEEAKFAASKTAFGEHFGYDIYEAGNGVYC